MDPVTPSIGWGVLHLYYRVDREAAERDPEAGKRITDAVASLEADGHQVVCMAMLGHKADLGVMALGPDLARLQASAILPRCPAVFSRMSRRVRPGHRARQARKILRTNEL